jgi:glycosyltransferase involved in cell wall biosynthesis
MTKLAVITPAHDEAEHLERTARAVAAQSRPPDLWLVVDDGSTDATPRILTRLAARLPFLRVLQLPPRPGADGADGLDAAAEACAFNLALAGLDLAEFTHVGKLDADIELSPEYFERILAAFAAEPELGIAGGTLLEHGRHGWHPTRVHAHHVRGALKLYSRECFLAIGGIQERLGWDTIDETYARMRGFRTRSLPDVSARHHRSVGSRGGTLRGRARHGHCAYVLRYGIWWVAARSFKVARLRPYGISGLAFLYGYLRAAARRAERVEDEEFRLFVAAELRGRARLPKVPPFFVRS